MNRIWCCLFLIFFGISPLFAQSISKTWDFEAVEDSNQNSLFEISPGNDYLKLDNGDFEFALTTEGAPGATGNYVFQNDVLVLFLILPKTVFKFQSSSPYRFYTGSKCKGCHLYLKRSTSNRTGSTAGRNSKNFSSKSGIHLYKLLARCTGNDFTYPPRLFV